MEYRGVVSQQPRKIRRRPNFAAFLTTGGLIGLFVGFLVSVLGPAAISYDASAAVGFIGLIFAGLGVLAGAVIALLLDTRS